MSGGRGRTEGPSALEIIDGAFRTARSRPDLLAVYYAGALPFVLALLYFWADMSRSPLAYAHRAPWAFALSLLFLWMKSWQAAFGVRVMDHLHARPERRMGLRACARLVLHQSILQPLGAVALPVALMALLPFGWAYAFMQNASVLDDGEQDLGEVIRRSWAQAGTWPMQNHLVIWLLSPWLIVAASLLVFVLVPFLSALSLDAPVTVITAVVGLLCIPLCPLGVVAAVNVAAALAAVPFMAKSLLGVDMMFTMSGDSLYNTTFFAVVVGLTYLCIDPFVKISYAVRCFRGESARTGEDLVVELRKLARAGAAVLLLAAALAGLPGDLPAAPSPAGSGQGVREAYIDPALLGRTVKQVLARPEYTWRMPREGQDKNLLDGLYQYTFAAKAMDTVEEWWGRAMDWVGRIVDWVKAKLFRENGQNREKDAGRARGSASLTLKVLLGVLAAGVALFLAAVGLQAWRKRRSASLAPVSAPASRAPDLRREDVDPTSLSESGWSELARELLARGESRLALRALHLASLSTAASRDLITVALYKTDREYLAELGRRAHGRPVLLGAFTENVRLFEEVWYGTREASPETVERFRANHEEVKRHAV